MYKGVRYRARSLDEIRGLVKREARWHRTAHRIFLADGDVMRRPFVELDALLTLLRESFPGVRRINTYASGSAILAKSDDELRALRAGRLHTLYMGLESGDEAILTAVGKGESAAEMVDACIRAQSAGLRLSVMVLLGLGGSPGSEAHAAATAIALNRMQPRLLSALRVVPVAGTLLERDVAAGRFEQLSEYGVVAELRAIVADLELKRTVFRANHSSNVMPLEASLPRGKAQLLAQLDHLLGSGRLDRDTPGRLPMWL
jgi:radical SAM superfamily enzyme YgiQ (UPF0313 family)